MSGIRALPQLNYKVDYENNSLLDFELSLNAYGNANMHWGDSIATSGKVKPYRLWGRYSTTQLEIRIGLQKIDFGQAMILRPLMWFDSVDPRDPLGITDGIYGGLMRYYFLDNTNIWLWGLYGNETIKGLEWATTKEKTPELGARIQKTLLGGEVGLSYHYRKANVQTLFPAFTDGVNENRWGVDARWDFVIGTYIEAAWFRNSEELTLSINGQEASVTNQEFITSGIDYTFPIGAGLYTVLEHMLVGSSSKAFDFKKSINISAMQISYPIGMFDNFTAIIYYDWANSGTYNFVNWSRQYDRLTMHLMGYWNPQNSPLPMPGQSGVENLMSGRGVQGMLVYNF